KYKILGGNLGAREGRVQILGVAGPKALCELGDSPGGLEGARPCTPGGQDRVRGMEEPSHQPAAGPQEGDLVEAAVTRLAHGGAGVARVDGLVVFVRGGLPGDTLRARIRARRRAFAEAEVVEILAPSPQRVSPPCPHFGSCGGCHWMDLA